NKSIDLRTILPPALPRASADAGKVRQILLNLLSNAVKFTERGTISISAQCVIMPAGQPEPLLVAENGAANGHAAQHPVGTNGRTPYIAISVRDSGIGIAP